MSLGQLPARGVAVMFPRALLPLRREDLARLTGVRIVGHNGTGGLVSRPARELPAQIDDSTATDGARIGTAVIDLLAVAPAARLDRGSALPRVCQQHALLRRIHAFIEQHLADPDRFGCGRRWSPRPRHGEAVAHITWCVTEHRIGVLTGEVGAGKTVAIRAALAGLDPTRHTIVYLPDPTIGVRGINHHVVAALGGHPLVHQLVGQPTLRRKIKLGQLAALDQRIALRYAMPPMTPEETGSYLRRHLTLAGRSDPLFSDDATALIHQTSRGYPRAVNNLALQALVAAFAENKTIVDESAARAVAEVTAE